MAQQTILSVTANAIDELFAWLVPTLLIWLIPHLIFWIICVVAVIGVSVGAVNVHYQLVSKALDSSYSFSRKMSGSDANKAGAVIIPLLSLFYLFVRCVNLLNKAASSEEIEDEWPGSVKIGVGYVLAITCGHILLVIVMAMGCVALGGWRYLSGKNAVRAEGTDLLPFERDSKTECTLGDWQCVGSNSEQEPELQGQHESTEVCQLQRENAELRRRLNEVNALSGNL
ncbi:hypothetical protein LTR56_013257 [Elasticomyces elasticus]|nr:hypothetical protein LTR56_013257 [Elasticomyces elasticus]KAK3650114.1 hypothetical protein LTR22_012709 [Elasticomyces elasticus]KAK4920049.1 hypothetical protein LTR49_012310 [Elasticomyces elasticus]KAK5757226.1 hypothetical protein LTS12_012742 [Elasticomyces elasticus]